MQWVHSFLEISFGVFMYVARCTYTVLVKFVMQYTMTTILFIVLLISLLSSCLDATGKCVCVCVTMCDINCNYIHYIFHQQLYWSHHLIRHVLETQPPTHVSLILDTLCGVRIIKIKYCSP